MTADERGMPVAVRPERSLSDEISLRFRRRRCWNPISAAGLDQVADHLRLGTARTMLDVGCGPGSLTCDWTAQFDLDGRGVDIVDAYVDRARDEASRRGLQDRVRFATADGRSLVGSDRSGFDRVVALGVAGGLGGFAATVDLLTTLTAPGGRFAVGDQLPGIGTRPADVDPDHGRLVAVVRSSPHDVDAYYADQWQAVLDWADAEPSHPDVGDRLAAVRAHQQRYLNGDCPDLDWAVFVFRKD